MSLAIGMMSGTSADGIDVSLVQIKNGIKFIKGAFYPYPAELKNFILKISTIEELTRANFALAEVFSEAANRFIESLGIEKKEISVLSSHGQTIRHLPEFARIGRLKVRGTLQIGDISVIAMRTEIITAGDFRPAHIAGGGEGAPLSPFFHKKFFFSPREKRAVINIGGIANITFINSKPMFAFDAGPGNMVIDGIVKILFGKEMDRDGKIAYKGKPDEKIIEKMLSHPFFKKKPPKSTGREEFGSPFIKNYCHYHKNMNFLLKIR